MHGARDACRRSTACTDNAAMIALVAKGKFDLGEFSDPSMDATPNMSL